MDDTLKSLIELRTNIRQLLFEKANNSSRSIAFLLENSLHSKLRINFETNYRSIQKDNVDPDLIKLWDAYLDLGDIILNFIEKK